MKVSEIMKKALYLEDVGRYLQAAKFYKYGLSELLDLRECEYNLRRRNRLLRISEEFTSYADLLRMKLKTVQSKGKAIERILIADGAKGHSYKSLFGKYMSDGVKEILIEDPYVWEHYQIQNLIMFLELVVGRCCELKFVQLKTRKAHRTGTRREQKKASESLKEDLRKRRIIFDVEYSKSMHDREIFLGNRLIISIGRGLDIFKPLSRKYSLGMMDYNFRECGETKIDIFKSKRFQ
ncbi:MITD1 family protein [Megaselia abdita]